MATGPVRVRGLQQLTRDFRKLNKDVGNDVAGELEEVSDVVAQDAERRVLAEMTNIDSYFAATKVAVSQAKGVVYVVPAWRRGQKRSPKQREQVETAQYERYSAALAANEGKVVEKLERLIDRLGGQYDFY